jgi:uncharacterized protein YegP (UPF0339 family)
MNVPRFETYKDRRGKWRWRFRAANGRILAYGGEPFASKRNVLRAIKTVRETLQGMP